MRLLILVLCLFVCHFVVSIICHMYEFQEWDYDNVIDKQSCSFHIPGMSSTAAGNFREFIMINLDVDFSGY